MPPAAFALYALTACASGYTGDHITHIWAVRNPDKLRPWTTS
jgi:RNA polymerase sigma-70 factor (ECF subfamily)